MTGCKYLHEQTKNAMYDGVVWNSLHCFMETWLFKFLPAPKSMLHQFC